MALAKGWERVNEVVQVTKGNTITIPKQIRERSNIQPRQEVVVSLANDVIYIKKYVQGESLRNQVIINSYGSCYIPVEVRKQSNIHFGMKFEIFVYGDEMIKLVPVKELKKHQTRLKKIV